MDLRKIDALIAEHVMGWTFRGEHPIVSGQVWATGCSDTLLPRFSEDIGVAFPIAVTLDMTLIPVDDGWMAGVDNGHGYTDIDGVVDLQLGHVAIAKTATEAICRCALRIRGIKVPA